MKKPIWFITGISSGIGKALAETALAAGDFVIGTFRKTAQVDAFNEQHGDNAQALEMDITDAEAVERGFQTIENRFGRIDYLVNNAGFGIAGAVEETSEAELRAVFEANFFATVALTRRALPMLRQQGSGHIIQISSHGGVRAFPGFGVYNASKFALEGISEALAIEVKPLGIHVTIVEPGPFRTAFAGSGFQQAETRLDAYAETAGKFRNLMAGIDGKQPGDPQRAAEVIFQTAKLEEPPLRLPLGKIAVTNIRAKLDSVRADVERYEASGAVTEFEG